MINKIFERMQQFAKEGLFHIFGSRVISQVGALISSMVVIRFLEKAEYGHYVSANNIYSYPAIFVGMGMASAIMQFCSERVSENRKTAIFRHALLTGNGANFLVSLVTAGLALWKYQTGKPEVAFYLLLLCALPFVSYADSYSQTVLRVKLENKVFSYANIAFSVALLLGNIVLTNLFDVPGLIYSRYLAIFISAVFCMTALRKDRFFAAMRENEVRLERAEKRQVNSYAFVCAITNFASVVLTLLDITCLDLVLDDPTVLADYHVAVAIPAACIFVPSSLMTFFYPKLVNAISSSKREGLSCALQIAKVSALVNGFVFICLMVFAPLIIWIIYGEKYLNVISMFRVLSLNYLVHCASNITGNMIAAMKKVKINLAIAVFSGLLNVCLNLTLIPILGAIGAAVATVSVSATVAVLDFLYIWRTFRKAE